MAAARRLVPVFFITLLALSPLFVLTPKVSAAQSGLVRKHYCPEGYDATNATIYDLAANCHGIGDGISFSASGPGGYAQSGVTDGNGWVSFSNVPVGQITVSEDVPPDTEVRAFCDVKDFLGQGGGYVEYANPAVLQVDQDEAFDCDWYNIPPIDDEGTIMIRKHGCPDDYNAAVASIYDLAANCQDIQQGVDFKLEPSDGNPGNQLTDGNGWVTWENIKSGPGQIIETPPDGTTLIRVFCRQQKLTGEDTGFSEYPASNFTVNYDLMVGYDMDCDWFNSKAVAAQATATTAPGNPTATAADTNPTPPISQQTPTQDPERSSITVYSYTCEPGYDVFDQESDPALDCPEPIEQVQFRSVGRSKTASSPTDEDGKVVFANLVSGWHLLVENLPEDTDYAFVSSCTSNLREFDSPLFPFAMIAADGTIGYDVLPGENLECNWYNVPVAGNATVTITKRWCSTTPVSPATCELYTEGLALRLTPADGDGEPLTETTDDQGVAVFSVPAGAYTLQEPAGIEWCFADSDAFNSDGNVEVEGSEEVEIIIYNCGEQP